MHRTTRIAPTALALLAALSAPASAEPVKSVKIGLVSTLTGPPAVLGQHTRDGFQLAIKQLGGKIGGIPAEVVVVDDELKPEIGIQRVEYLIEREKVDAIVGIVFSNILMATARRMVDSKTVFIGTNAGPSPLAGRNCSPYLFSAAYQNDQNAEAMGRHATSRGYRKIVVVAPNYQAGKDVVAGFKREYKGEIVDEIFVPLAQPDFSSDLAKVVSSGADAAFVFMPGGLGVTFVKQWRQAGVALPMLSAHTIDETNLPALQEAAVGTSGVTNWSPALDVPASRAFVEAFRAEYKYTPANYAAHAYDAAMWLNAAVTASRGEIADRAKLIDALRKTKFESVRGRFEIGTNQFPIQDYYLVAVTKRDDGSYATEIDRKIVEGLPDAYGKDCKMPF
ncbi:ABC transporter substrate-binding protein [Bosea sp. RAF48]|uniref:ABC transporter substrate-binding protein n=1 Tax=Bosea sp. RAF48 TaxID=3237480 RepID=UPI003F934FC8